MNTENLKLCDRHIPFLHRHKLAEMDGCSMGGIYRIFNRRDFPLGRSIVSDDLSSDEISATGSHQSFDLN